MALVQTILHWFMRTSAFGRVSVFKRDRVLKYHLNSNGNLDGAFCVGPKRCDLAPNTV